jgi:hypothetical protein
MTHDLLANTIEELGGRLDRVVINALEGNTFYARLVVSQSDRVVSIDCRPSDAVALAVRAAVPMFVDREIIESMSPDAAPKHPGAPGPAPKSHPPKKK